MHNFKINFTLPSTPPGWNKWLFRIVCVLLAICIIGTIWISLAFYLYQIFYYPLSIIIGLIVIFLLINVLPRLAFGSRHFIVWGATNICLLALMVVLFFSATSYFKDSAECVDTPWIQNITSVFGTASLNTNKPSDQFVTLSAILKAVLDRTTFVNDTDTLEKLNFTPIKDLYYKKFYYKLSDGTPSFFGTDIASGDINGDKIADLLVSRIPVFSINDPCVYLVLSPYEQSRDIAISKENSLCIKTDFKLGASMIGDVNGDGKKDIILGDTERLLLSSWLFSKNNEIDFEALPLAGVKYIKIISDMNKDGYNDFIIRDNNGTHILSSKQIFGVNNTDYVKNIALSKPLYELPENGNGGKIDSLYSAIGDIDGDNIDEITLTDNAKENGSVTILFSKSGFSLDNSFKIKIPAATQERTETQLRISSRGDFDNDGHDDFWIQDPNNFIAYLITSSSVGNQAKMNISEKSVEKLASFTMTSRWYPSYEIKDYLIYNEKYSSIRTANIDDPRGMLGYARLAVDYNSDGFPDFIFSNSAMFQGRGAFFAISGKRIQDLIKNGVTASSVTDNFVVKIAPYRYPISWLSPMKIAVGGDFSGDNIPDPVLGADYDTQGGIGAGAAYVIDGAKLGSLFK